MADPLRPPRSNAMVDLGTIPVAGLEERLLEVWEATGDAGLQCLLAGRVPGPGAGGADGPLDRDSLAQRRPLAELADEQRADWVSTVLMDCYKRTGDRRAFALLHEINERSFLAAVKHQLHRSGRIGIDPFDVLQEAFLNVFRYPHRFVADRADAFRNWGHRIVRNTLLKCLKGEGRRARITPLDEDVALRADPHQLGPLRQAADAESARVVDRAFLLWLNLYLVHFEALSAREKRALTLVEVDGVSYRDAAADLGIRLENLKMVVFRGRRKILRGMNQSLARLGLALADQRRAGAARPARTPRPASRPATSPPEAPARPRFVKLRAPRERAGAPGDDTLLGSTPASRRTAVPPGQPCPSPRQSASPVAPAAGSRAPSPPPSF
ncbi:MAG: sigma-70 family RNA polymerase sigma factor [Planctomycetes bacterium]|nr:sigma-70 family RNA polymerase sigma factor [Planctomycetota bacterium]